MADPSCHEIRIEELEKRLNLHVAYQQQAVEKASLELRERLATMNEFREQLKDQAATFIRRDEVVGLINRTIQRIEALEQSNANWEGKIWAGGVLATLLGGAIGSMIAWLLRG